MKNVRALQRRTLPDGAAKRGTMTFTRAKAPTCTTEIPPAIPSVTPNRSAISAIKNGVAENIRVTEPTPANTTSGAPGRSE